MNRQTRKSWIIPAALALLLTLIANPLVCRAQDTEDIQMLRRTSRAFSAVAKKAMPAVVNVSVEKTIASPSRSGAPSEFGNPFGDDFFRHFFGPGQRPQQPRKQL